MNNFMIGQYGTFDYTKFHRDYKEPFYGIEACLFDQEADILNLIKESKAHKFEIGIHFPLRGGRSSLRDALFLSQDDSDRDNAFELIQQELDGLVHVKPRYVLFHYPKPVILDDRVDWSPWRFADRKEYVYESQYALDELKAKSEYLFQWLSVKGQYTDKIEKYHFPVLPEQKPEEGWAPIAEYLKIIREENRSVKFQFEHRSDYISDEDLERCYEWVDRLVNR